MLGQTQANGPSDFAFVRAIGDQYQLTPLSAWGKPYTPPNDVAVDPDVILNVTPPDQVAKMDAQTFFNRLAMAMKDNPPYAEDKDALEKLKSIGVEPGKPFDISKLDPRTRRGLEKAVADILGKIAEKIPETQERRRLDSLPDARPLRHRLRNARGRCFHGSRREHARGHGLSNGVSGRRRQSLGQRTQIRDAFRQGTAAAYERHLVSVAVQGQLL